ncbi:MAG: glycosyltransferase [Lutibacter sp.]|jgi:glycosyltransferase involved in cell wall biosynthesis
MKVLYVCPFAHYSGHHPHVSKVEPEYLQKAGIDVTLLTFSGIINNAEVNVKHVQVLKGHDKLQGIFKKIRLKTLPRWVIMFTETIFTLRKAIQMQRKDNYDVLHWRDGEPFIFLSHLLSLPYRNINWFVSLTAAIVFKPKLTKLDIIRRPFVVLYTAFLYFMVNNSIWKLLYKLSAKRNNHFYAPQNSLAEKAYKGYLNGIFKDKVECIELGIGDHIQVPDKELSRKRLGLPLNKFILLSFGAPNAGKDMDTMFKAISQSDAYLVHGGTHTFSLGSSPIELAQRYNLNGRAKIFNYFISEEEKPYFFGATDAIVLSYNKSFASTSSMMWEAARYKLPVISSNANSLGKDVARYNLGLLFEAQDSISLRDAVKKYQRLTPNEIESFKIGCEKFVRDYSDTKWAEKCIKVYKRLLNEQ